jgi:hypothetical protein
MTPLFWPEMYIESISMEDAMKPKPCPDCNEAPASRLEANNQVVLFCGRHGHIASGDDLDSAVSHWNIYIGFVRKTQ